MNTPLVAETITHLGPLPITNTMLMSWLVMIVLVVVSLLTTAKLSKIPAAAQNFTEYVIEYLYDLTKSVSNTNAGIFFPIFATLFLFILISNWMGLVPGLGALGFWQSQGHSQVFIPLFRSADSDLNTTLGLSLITVAVTQYFGIKYLGIYGWVKHYFHNPLKNGIGMIILGSFIGAFVGLLEIVSEIVKVISLSFRLFGNIYAGEVVISTVTGLFSYILPVPFMLLETIVGMVQAAVFALLTLVFFVIITTPIEEH